MYAKLWLTVQTEIYRKIFGSPCIHFDSFQSICSFFLFLLKSFPIVTLEIRIGRNWMVWIKCVILKIRIQILYEIIRIFLWFHTNFGWPNKVDSHRIMNLWTSDVITCQSMQMMYRPCTHLQNHTQTSLFNYMKIIEKVEVFLHEKWKNCRKK